MARNDFGHVVRRVPSSDGETSTKLYRPAAVLCRQEDGELYLAALEVEWSDRSFPPPDVRSPGERWVIDDDTAYTHVTGPLVLFYMVPAEKEVVTLVRALDDRLRGLAIPWVD